MSVVIRNGAGHSCNVYRNLPVLSGIGNTAVMEMGRLNMNYPINYTRSFVLLWGLSLSVGLFIGGLLTFALVSMMILVLISHEHAHLKQCELHNVKVNSVAFTWLGGAIDLDIKGAKDGIPVLFAGVVDTGMYTLSAVVVWAALNFTRPLGLNFANNPYLNLLNSITLFCVVMFISNILPISYNSEKHGIITTDGWATYKLLKL